jgi:hypothetical protein
MLSTSARFALLASAPLFSGLACAEAPASPAVVLAPVAPPSGASAPTVDSSTAATSGDARVPSAALGSDAGAPAEFRACNVDADCVAVPRVGCCHNGWKEAVAASRRDAYAASFVCPEAHPICAMFIVRDARATQCDAATHLCTLVAKAY